MERYVCIHGHFYLPPRENPWLEAIEIQDSAHPYHDWNERVAAQCYSPNFASRILDGGQRILDITSNYENISFNFGPTLLSWMETFSPEIYQGILDADRKSMELHSGHGNAIAQAYRSDPCEISRPAGTAAFAPAGKRTSGRCRTDIMPWQKQPSVSNSRKRRQATKARPTGQKPSRLWDNSCFSTPVRCCRRSRRESV